MKFYKVAFQCDSMGSEGFSYFTTKREAETVKREYESNNSEHAEATIEVIEVRPTKDGILDALREHGSHNDNG